MSWHDLYLIALGVLSVHFSQWLDVRIKFWRGRAWKCPHEGCTFKASSSDGNFIDIVKHSHLENFHKEYADE